MGAAISAASRLIGRLGEPEKRSPCHSVGFFFTLRPVRGWFLHFVIAGPAQNETLRKRMGLAF
jgi:hypothetical protein